MGGTLSDGGYPHAKYYSVLVISFCVFLIYDGPNGSLFISIILHNSEFRILNSEFWIPNSEIRRTNWSIVFTIYFNSAILPVLVPGEE